MCYFIFITWQNRRTWSHSTFFQWKLLCISLRILLQQKFIFHCFHRTLRTSNQRWNIMLCKFNDTLSTGHFIERKQLWYLSYLITCLVKFASTIVFIVKQIVLFSFEWLSKENFQLQSFRPVHLMFGYQKRCFHIASVSGQLCTNFLPETSFYRSHHLEIHSSVEKWEALMNQFDTGYFHRIQCFSLNAEERSVFGNKIILSQQDKYWWTLILQFSTLQDP